MITALNIEWKGTHYEGEVHVKHDVLGVVTSAELFTVLDCLTRMIEAYNEGRKE